MLQFSPQEKLLLPNSPSLLSYRVSCNLKQVMHKGVYIINLYMGFLSILSADMSMAASRHLTLLLPT